VEERFGAETAFENVVDCVNVLIVFNKGILVERALSLIDLEGNVIVSDITIFVVLKLIELMFFELTFIEFKIVVEILVDDRLGAVKELENMFGFVKVLLIFVKGTFELLMLTVSGKVIPSEINKRPNCKVGIDTTSLFCPIFNSGPAKSMIDVFIRLAFIIFPTVSPL
jgi:hypothetical protein